MVLQRRIGRIWRRRRETRGTRAHGTNCRTDVAGEIAIPRREHSSSCQSSAESIAIEANVFCFEIELDFSLLHSVATGS